MDIMNEDNIIMNSNVRDKNSDALYHQDSIIMTDGVIDTDIDIIHADVPNAAYDLFHTDVFTMTVLVIHTVVDPNNAITLYHTDGVGYIDVDITNQPLTPTSLSFTRSSPSTTPPFSPILPT